MKAPSFLLVLILAILSLGSAAAAHALLGVDQFWDFADTQGAMRLLGDYKESPDNGLIDLTLDFEVENLAPSTVFQVQAVIRNGTRTKNLGTLTTDAFGDADFRRELLNRPIGPDGRPVGKRLETGDVIRVINQSVGIELNGPLVPRA